MERTEGYVPGTDYLFVSGIEGEDVQKRGDIVLIPQPTISPNDPLNWSPWRKYMQLLMVLVVTGLTAATSNSASAAQDGIIDEYGYSWNIFNTGAGVLFIGIGYWTLLSAPSVSLWGCRINYLFGTLLGIVGNAWYAKTKTVGDAIWSQLFIGASESVTEAVAQLSITQVFFQHQAGHFIGLYVTAVSVGTFLGPLIGGFAADNLGWPWVGWLGLICSAFTLVLIFFGLEETYFDRAHFESGKRVELNAVSSSQGVNVNKSEKENDGNESKIYPKDSPGSHSPLEVTTSTTVRPDIVGEQKQEISDKPKTYWQRIAVITPAVNLKGWGLKQYCERLFLMLRVFLFPPVIYSGLQWGAQDAWLTFYITVEDDNWSEDPYDYSDAGVAIMNVPTLIGAIIGCIYSGWVSDYFVIWMAKRNNGLREAETRLWLMFAAAVISPLGMFLFGIGTEHGWGSEDSSISWAGPYIALGFIGFGWGCAGDISMSYLVDCYPEMVLEGMVGVSVINNTLGMIFSFVCDPWMTAGVQNSFIAIGVLDFFFLALTLPMIIWGKKCREWTRTWYFDFVERRDKLDS